MAFQTSTVTIVSDNPLYPNNKVTLTVDNDLDPTNTVVVLNTNFPYIVEFTNCPAAIGKRYLSDWLYKRLLDKYTTNRGRVYNTLQKDICPYPYITLDYELLKNEIQKEKDNLVSLTGNKINKSDFVDIISFLDSVGVSLQSYEDVNPIYILQWLDLPIIDANGNAIKSFPILLGYKNKTDLEVITNLLDRKVRDFFATRYVTYISYPTDSEIQTSSTDDYNRYVANKPRDYFDKSKKFNKIVSKSKNKSINEILSNIDKIKSGVLGAIGLVSTASALKSKLDALKNAKISINRPTFKKISFRKLLVTNKIKKAEQKTKKKKQLSGKKGKLPSVPPELKNPSVENLKSQAGSLKQQTQNLQSEALKKQALIDAKRKELDEGFNRLQSYMTMTDAQIEASIRAEGYTGPLKIVRTPGRINILRGDAAK